MMMTMPIASLSLFLSLLGTAAATPIPDGPTAPRAEAPTPSTGVAPPAAPATAPPAPVPASAPATLAPASARTAAANAEWGSWPPDGGFAMELGTGGLSGTIGGSLGLGWGWRRFQYGIAFDVTHADLTEQAGGDNLGHQRTTALAVGPWIRWTIGHTRDGRVDAIGAMDFQYTRMSADVANGDTGMGNSGTADGIVFRAGPGLRYWATPWLALSYTAQVSVADLGGPLIAFTGVSGSTLGPLNYNFGDFQVALVGRLSVLAVF